MTIIKRFAMGLLRLLIGVGFTFSLVLGVTLTILILFSGTGNTLVLNRTGPNWGWGGGAAIAWALTLFWWFCWRCLPPVKPRGLFSALERSLLKPSSLISLIISAIATACGLCLTLGAGLELLAHAAGASWIQFWFYCAIAVISGNGFVSGWKQRRRKKQTKLFVDKFYRQG